MNRNKTKFIYFGVFVLFLACVIGLQCLHNRRMIQVQHEEWRKRSDSIVAVEMEKYYKAIARRDAKVDSIIRKLNVDRKVAKLPPLNMRIEGERVVERWMSSDDPFVKMTMLGACHYDSAKNQYSDAVLFNLYRPDEVIYLEMEPTTAEKFVGKHSRRHASYEMRLMDLVLLPSELDMLGSPR